MASVAASPGLAASRRNARPLVAKPIPGEQGLKTNQGDWPRQAHDNRSGDFIVPALLLAVPANPEEAQKQGQDRKDRRQTPHQRRQKSQRMAVFARHVKVQNNSSNGRSFPRPHSGKISNRGQQGKGAYHGGNEAEQRKVQKSRSHSFPKTRAGKRHRWGKRNRGRSRRRLGRQWRPGERRRRWGRGRERRRAAFAAQRNPARGHRRAESPETENQCRQPAQYRDQIQKGDEDRPEQESGQHLLPGLKAKRTADPAADVFQ